MKTEKKIGYFGGTFDPPHLGHFILAIEALHQLELDGLHWILTPDPPHKTNLQLSPVDNRLEMLQLMVDAQPRFEINLIDINRNPPHYAADTVDLIKENNPADQLVYIIGEDSLRDLPGWHDPIRFIKTVDLLAVAPRSGFETDPKKLEQLLPEVVGKLVFLKDIKIEIASSVIRSRIRDLEPFQHFLLEAVAQYLQDHQLYR